jgi:hypothetical protein
MQQSSSSMNSISTKLIKLILLQINSKLEIKLTVFLIGASHVAIRFP